MAAGGVFLALAAGLGVGGLVLYARRQKAAEAPPTPAPSADPCERLKEYSQQAYDACKALNGVKNILSGIADFITPANPTAEYYAAVLRNDELNGAIEIPTSPKLASLGWRGSNGQHPAMIGKAIRYKNGCTPFKGSPGWSRCAPGTTPAGWDSAVSVGTYSNVTAGGNSVGAAGATSPTVFVSRFAKLLTGEVTFRILKAGDPLLVRESSDVPALGIGAHVWEGDPTTGVPALERLRAASDIITGLKKLQGGWYDQYYRAVWNGGIHKGVPFVCPDGKIAAFGPGGAVPCRPWVNTPAVTVGGVGVAGSDLTDTFGLGAFGLGGFGK